MFNNWNKESYKLFIQYLIDKQDAQYKEFHSGLVLNSKYEIIGIRLPILRQIAKEVARTNIEDFLRVAQNRYYEEVMIQGLVISHIKDDQTFYNYFSKHIYKIDNWALCDTFCSSIKIIRKYENKYFNIAKQMSTNEDEFISRIGLILILNHFINENNLESIFSILDSINSNKYYTNMAEAWLVCDLYIKFPRQTLEFIKHNNLNTFTQNKAISKIHDSYRVRAEDKIELSKFRKI